MSMNHLNRNGRAPYKCSKGETNFFHTCRSRRLLCHDNWLLEVLPMTLTFVLKGVQRSDSQVVRDYSIFVMLYTSIAAAMLVDLNVRIVVLSTLISRTIAPIPRGDLLDCPSHHRMQWLLFCCCCICKNGNEYHWMVRSILPRFRPRIIHLFWTWSHHPMTTRFVTCAREDGSAQNHIQKITKWKIIEAAIPKYAGVLKSSTTIA